MNWKELRSWLAFIVPPIVAVAVAYGAITARLDNIEKQQDRNTDLIIQLIQQ